MDQYAAGLIAAFAQPLLLLLILAIDSRIRRR